MSALREVYMTWHLENSKHQEGFFVHHRSMSLEEIAGTIVVKVVDLFCRFY
jgi:hypothetical protein